MFAGVLFRQLAAHGCMMVTLEAVIGRTGDYVTGWIAVSVICTRLILRWSSRTPPVTVQRGRMARRVRNVDVDIDRSHGYDFL